MKARDIATLEQAIQTWLDELPDDWSSMVIGDRAAELMTRAAVAVLDACEESQQYGVAAGVFVTAD